jgi:hypothetical protein
MTTETKRQTGTQVSLAELDPDRQDAMPRPDPQSILFFDGEFRTWDQVEYRARLNRAIASYIAWQPVELAQPQ